MALLRGRFEAARPVHAVVSLDVGVNGRFERALETGEIVCKRTVQWSPRRAPHIVA